MSLAYRNGAVEGSVKVMELDLIPLQYVTNNAVRAVVKAVSGTVDFRFHAVTNLAFRLGRCSGRYARNHLITVRLRSRTATLIR